MSSNINDGSLELFAIRNALYLGDYELSLEKNESFDDDVDSKIELERRVLFYRAHIELGNYEKILSEIKESSDDTPIDLKSIYYLAKYFNSLKTDDTQNASEIVTIIDKNVDDPVWSTNGTFLIVASVIYSNEGSLTSALKILQNPTSLELCSFKISVLLQMNRPDLANVELKQMNDLNDYATITQLTAIYVLISRGGKEHLEEANSALEELIEKFGETPALLNLKACYEMQNSNFADAEKLLYTSLEKRPKHPETLVNLIVCSEHLNRDKDVISKFTEDLENTKKNFQLVQQTKEIGDEFDNFASKYRAQYDIKA